MSYAPQHIPFGSAAAQLRSASLSARISHTYLRFAVERKVEVIERQAFAFGFGVVIRLLQQSVAHRLCGHQSHIGDEAKGEGMGQRAGRTPPIATYSKD
jgi:hypothetical protein